MGVPLWLRVMVFVYEGERERFLEGLWEGGVGDKLMGGAGAGRVHHQQQVEGTKSGFTQVSSHIEGF